MGSRVHYLAGVLTEPPRGDRDPRPVFAGVLGWLALAGLACGGCSAGSASDLPRIVASAPAAEEEARPPAPEGEISRSHGKLEFLSPVYTIDRIYRSMTGPWHRQRVCLLETPQPELLWITGCHVEMLDADAEEPVSPLFMCHVNLDLDIERHKQRFDLKSFRDERLFTLSQGQLAVHFPPGCGVPILSDEPIDITTQVLNLNSPDEEFKVRHHLTVDYIRECDLTAPMRPLLECGVVGLVSLEGHELAYDASEILKGAKCVSCCAPGQKAVEWAEGLDNYARRFSNHWIVQPGRHEYRTRATTTLSLTEDSTIQCIAVHLHPFAEKIELRDLTSGEMVFASHARNLTDEIGLEHVDSFAGGEGLPVFFGHEYEIVTTYDNTSDENQDAMAIMYVYLLDKEYRRPRLPGDRVVAARPTPAPVAIAPPAAAK